MGFGQWLASNVTPLLLRLGLAAVFLWAGYGKLAYNDPVSGEDAAILANMGVIKIPTALPAPKEPPSDSATPAESTPPEKAPPPELPPASSPDTKAPDGQSSLHGRPQQEFALVRVRVQSTESPKSEPAPATMSPTPAPFAAEDFPTPVMVPRLYQIALLLHRASHPTDPAKQLWPTALAENGTLRMFAWLAAITEVAGGALVLFGFLTRIASLGLASTMVVALLLTTVGPAVVSGDGFLGFLPKPGMSHAEGAGAAWSTLMFQWTLLTASLGLMFAGAGALSLDRLIFGKSRARPSQAPKPT
ncbi:MAG: DoxX family membrane protein [Phycisphaerae bacterium]|nr:DoxX family membrane protein [Phycisphaerae bacterium]